MRVFKFNWTPSFGVVFHVYLLQMFFLVCVCALSFDIEQSWFCAKLALHRKMHRPIIYVWEPSEPYMAWPATSATERPFFTKVTYFF